MEQIVKVTGELFNCETKITKLGSTPPTINNEEKAKEIEKILKSALGANQVQNLDYIFTGSEDFAYISEKVPSLYIPLVAGNIEEGFKYTVHHPKVLIDERALKYGVTTFVASAIEWLKNNK
ncbi:MAG: M20/M25/M40 family metallo-hydrolase [Bacilli bacterium]